MELWQLILLTIVGFGAFRIVDCLTRSSEVVSTWLRHYAQRIH